MLKVIQSFTVYKKKYKSRLNYLPLFSVGKTVLILEPERGLAQIIDILEWKVLSSQPHRVLLEFDQHHPGSRRRLKVFRREADLSDGTLCVDSDSSKL